MRITNKIMQNNTLANINNNKISQDKLSTMMGTQKKITRPSDDPVIAIRALRLRSSVSQITQYYEKNVPDAESWLDVTEDALDNVSKVLTDMIREVTKGASESLTTADRKKLIENLQALRDEIYANGEGDYAGRYLFTGYRTDTTLSFTEATDKISYSITEQLDSSALDKITHINTSYTVPGTGGAADNYYDITDLKDSNYNDTGYKDINDTNSVTVSEVYRLRLSYKDCSEKTGASLPQITANGITYAPTSAQHSYDKPSPYENVPDDGVVYLADTGELLLGKDVYAALSAVQDNPATSNIDEGEIQVTYTKDSWEKGDLRPEHYFACTSTDDKGKVINYNQDYLTFGYEKQKIEYDVGFNQRLEVNTTADECFVHGIGREIDDLVNAMQQMVNLEDTISTLKHTLEGLPAADTAKKEVLEKQLAAANKALTFAKENVETEFGAGITSMQGYLDKTNLAITNCGTRGKKLELIESRLMSQQTTFETLQSNNEDADMAEVAVKLTSAEMTYEASLMATGKIMQTSLLNFL